MSIKIENIQFEEGEFARLLRWSDDVDQVMVFTSEGDIPLQGSGSLWHIHDELELTLVTSGQGTWLVGDQIRQFAAPCLVVLGSRLPHYWHFQTLSSGLCVHLNVTRLASVLPVSGRNEILQLAKRSTHGLLFHEDLRNKCGTILKELYVDNSLSRLGTLLRLFGVLANSPSSLSERLSSQQFDVSRLSPGYESIQRVILFMMSRFSGDLKLAEALEVACMSKATFSRRFVAYTGKTFSEFLNDIRIDYACQKLRGSDESISEIAFGTGYNNLSHFNRMFRRHRNCSPREYRRLEIEP